MIHDSTLNEWERLSQTLTGAQRDVGLALAVLVANVRAAQRRRAMWTEPMRLHEALDVLVAQYLEASPFARPSNTSVLELIEWSGARSRSGKAERALPLVVADVAQIAFTEARDAEVALARIRTLLEGAELQPSPSLEDEFGGSNEGLSRFEQEVDREARALLRRTAAGVVGLDWSRAVLGRALELQQQGRSNEPSGFTEEGDE